MNRTRHDGPLIVGAGLAGLCQKNFAAGFLCPVAGGMGIIFERGQA